MSNYDLKTNRIKRGDKSSKLPAHLFLLIFLLSPRDDSITVELFTKLFFGCLQLSTWVLSTTDWWSSQHFSERNNTLLISFFLFLSYLRTIFFFFAVFHRELMMRCNWMFHVWGKDWLSAFGPSCSFHQVVTE